MVGLIFCAQNRITTSYFISHLFFLLHRIKLRLTIRITGWQSHNVPLPVRVNVVVRLRFAFFITMDKHLDKLLGNPQMSPTQYVFANQPNLSHYDEVNLVPMHTNYSYILA